MTHQYQSDSKIPCDEPDSLVECDKCGHNDVDWCNSSGCRDLDSEAIQKAMEDAHWQCQCGDYLLNGIECKACGNNNVPEDEWAHLDTNCIVCDDYLSDVEWEDYKEGCNCICDDCAEVCTEGDSDEPYCFGKSTIDTIEYDVCFCSVGGCVKPTQFD